MDPSDDQDIDSGPTTKTAASSGRSHSSRQVKLRAHGLLQFWFLPPGWSILLLSLGLSLMTPGLSLLGAPWTQLLLSDARLFIPLGLAALVIPWPWKKRLRPFPWQRAYSEGLFVLHAWGSLQFFGSLGVAISGAALAVLHRPSPLWLEALGLGCLGASLPLLFRNFHLTGLWMTGRRDHWLRPTGLVLLALIALWAGLFRLAAYQVGTSARSMKAQLQSLSATVKALKPADADLRLEVESQEAIDTLERKLKDLDGALEAWPDAPTLALVAHASTKRELELDPETWSTLEALMGEASRLMHPWAPQLSGGRNALTPFRVNQGKYEPNPLFERKVKTLSHYYMSLGQLMTSLDPTPARDLLEKRGLPSSVLNERVLFWERTVGQLLPPLELPPTAQSLPDMMALEETLLRVLTLDPLETTPPPPSSSARGDLEAAALRAHQSLSSYRKLQGLEEALAMVPLGYDASTGSAVTAMDLEALMVPPLDAGARYEGTFGCPCGDFSEQENVHRFNCLVMTWPNLKAPPVVFYRLYSVYKGTCSVPSSFNSLYFEVPRRWGEDAYPLFMKTFENAQREVRHVKRDRGIGNIRVGNRLRPAERAGDSLYAEGAPLSAFQIR